MPVTLVCPQCEQTFRRKPSQAAGSRFCSPRCYTESGEQAENGRNNGLKGVARWKGKGHPFLGRHHLPESIKKMQMAKLGEKNPQFGKPLTDRQLEVLRQPVGKSHPGWHHTEKCKQRMGQLKKEWCSDPKVRAEMSARFSGELNPCYGKEYTKDEKANLRAKSKAAWQKPEYFRMMMGKFHTKPNKKELLLDSWLQEAFPNEWKYVGDGQFILGGKCPDWVNVNGHKALIELYGEYWHQEDEEAQRKAHFSQFGFETLIIWESALRDKEVVIDRIRDFVFDRH